MQSHLVGCDLALVRATVRRLLICDEKVVARWPSRPSETRSAERLLTAKANMFAFVERFTFRIFVQLASLRFCLLHSVNVMPVASRYRPPLWLHTLSYTRIGRSILSDLCTLPLYFAHLGSVDLTCFGKADPSV